MKKVISVLMSITLFFSMFSVIACAAYENTWKNTGNQRADIIGVAKTQVGYLEGSNNNNKYGSYFGSNNVSWCAYFIVWCARQANIDSSVIKTTGWADADDLGVSYKSRGSYTPNSGDIIIFDYAPYSTKTPASSYGDHVGLVEYVENGYVHTIEGNSNDQVRRGSYSLSYSEIKGYGVPNYKNSSTNPPSGYVNLGTNFFAYIINKNGKYLTDKDYDVFGSDGTKSINQVWNFIRNTDGSYSIKTTGTYCIDAVNYGDKPGTDLQVIKYADNEAQRFYIYKNGSYYQIRSAYADLWFDMDQTNYSLALYDKWGDALDQQLFKITEVSYAVSFHANGGIGAPGKQTKKHGTDLLLSSTKPTKSFTITYNANSGSVSTASKTVNCTFKNWNTKSDGTGTAYSSGAKYTQNADATIYAQWTNPTAGTMATPTRTGYTFDGWYTAASGGSKVTESTTISKNITVYAHWTANKVTMKYLTIGDALCINHNDTPYTDGQLVLKAPLEWVSAASVKYNGKSYTASGSKSSALVYNTESPRVSIADAGLTLTGHHGFRYVAYRDYDKKWKARVNGVDGWYTSAEISAAINNKTFNGYNCYAQTGPLTTTSPKGTIYFYAVWETNTLSVYYNANGGAINDEKKATYSITSSLIYTNGAAFYQKWYYDTAKESGLCNAASFGLYKTGYTFGGWGTTKTGGTVFDQNDATLIPSKINSGIKSGNVSTTLYAVWTPLKYTVAYNANGGSGAPANQTKSYGTDLTLSSTKPTKSFTITYNANSGTVSTSSKTVNCTFKNWNTKADGTGTAYNAGEKYTQNAAATLYAQWTNPTAGTMAAPARTGYTFDGWYTAASGGNKVTDSTTVSKNITVYAHWTTVSYTLSYDANGGSNAPSAQKGTNLIISSTVPVKSGCVFLGWSKNSMGSPEFVSGNSITLAKDTTLYAVWSRTAAAPYWGDLNNDHYVDYQDNNIINSIILEDVIPQNEQKCFADINLDGKITASDITALTTYINDSSKTIPTAEAEISFNPPSKSIYRSGESLNTSGAKVIVSNKNNPSVKYEFTDNITITGFNSSTIGKQTLTAAFRGMKFYFDVTVKTDSYTLSYNANGGNGAPGSQTGSDKYTISSVKPARSGYTFLGWSVSASAKTASYKSGDTVSLSFDTVLYAVWQLIPNTNPQVHSVRIDDISLNYKSSASLSTKIEADKGAKYTVKYSSSNEKIAVVDQNGKVTATKRGSGSASITCEVVDNNGVVVTDTCKVNVSLSFGQKIIVYLLFGWIWY